MEENKCGRCDKVFSTITNLQKHMKKKIPCYRSLSCSKCNKLFSHRSSFNKHISRKTPCEPIQGNPILNTPKNSCHFCYKKFKNKYNLKNHFNVCKIKNGGMMILFKKVKQLEGKIKDQNNEIKTLRANPKGHIINCDKIDISNHYNTQININFINWDDNHDSVKRILEENLPRILSAPKQDDIPLVQQVSNRVSNIIGIVFRNPDYKELQGMYVVDLKKNENNAFIYNDDKWVITNWDKLRTEMLQKLYMCKPKTKEGHKDVLDIIKYLFVLGKYGDCKSIKRLSNEDTLKMYADISKQLNFSGIKYIQD